MALVTYPARRDVVKTAREDAKGDVLHLVLVDARVLVSGHAKEVVPGVVLVAGIRALPVVPEGVGRLARMEVGINGRIS